MDNKYQNSRSRLPRMNVSTSGGSDYRRSDSSIPRPQKLNNNNINNNKIINNKLIVCNNNGLEEQKVLNNSFKYKSLLKAKTDSLDENMVKTNDCLNSNKTTTSLCKSQSLNEIQYKNSNYLTKFNELSNGFDSVKAISFERLDENFSNLENNSYLTKDYLSSDLNLMEMSVDESSTASLGLLPNIMSSISPFDSFNQNIPFVSIESNFLIENNIEMDRNETDFYNNRIEGDDDSENGIPTLQDDGSDPDVTITNSSEDSERAITAIVATNELNASHESSDGSNGSNGSVINQDMADEFETMNLDNSLTLKSNTDNESTNDMSIESNLSEANIPLNNELLFNKNNANNDLNKISKKSGENDLISCDNSSQSIVKSFNRNKTNDYNKSRVNEIKSSAVRPNSLNTSSTRDPKPTATTEKMMKQRAASPSGRTPVRKKIKTPGRWDAVMSKIEKSKGSITQNNKAIKGRIDSNISRNDVPNESFPELSPSDELSLNSDNRSYSHLNSTAPSLKSHTISSTAKKNTLNSNTSKVNIPKSKTFVRDSNGYTCAGSSRSQQPVLPQQPPSIPTTPVTPQPLPAPTEKSGAMLTIKKERDKGVFASINDKKTTNRRPTQSNTTGSTLTTKRMTNTKINASNANTFKKDVRSAQLCSDNKQQIEKLTQLCESKTKQLKTLGLDQNYMRLAFDSLSVVIQHLIEQFEPFENPKLKRALKNANKRCEQLKDNLDAKDLELNDMKIIFEEQINQLMKEREKNFSDLNQAKVSHELNIKKLKEMNLWEMKRIEVKHNTELELSQQNCNHLLNQIEQKNCELTQTKQSRDALQIRVNQIEDSIMNDKDKKFKYLTEKTKQLELEVESLKVVMDMKNEKIHTLERKMIETQEKINELPFAKETIRSLQQQVETLQITLERKIHQFNQLTREHEQLKCEYEKEMREKRRLSMKNEELEFHLNESFNESVSGLNNCTNFDSNYIRFRTPAINIDETPIKTNRSISMNSGSNAFSTHRKTHSKVSRSVSISTSTSTSSANSRGGPAIHCPSSGCDNETHFLNNSLSDEVFDSGTSFTNSNPVLESKGKKYFKMNRFVISSDETPPQSILDSGFEEIQGLNPLTKL